MPDPVLPGGVPSIPEFRPVRKALFSDRVKRLRDLARGHAMQEYLRFACALARAQATELDDHPGAAIPDEERLDHCREHGLSPLSIGEPVQDAWLDALKRLLAALNRAALPPQAAGILDSLHRADPAELHRDAAKLLVGAYSEIDAGRVPFIGAALQVHWAKMALKLGDAGRSENVAFGLCPVCGSPPVVSIVRTGGAEQGLRYLVCSLCSSEWHLVRVKCNSCASTGNISYLFVEGANDAVRAECCDDCNSYLKILYLEKDQNLEPVADDLATLALDLLVDEQGYRRLGPNLLLAPGLEA
jgi:FdhE protein